MVINNIIEIEGWHPKLRGKNWKIIYSENKLLDFNCIAFVLDVYDNWYGSSTEFWPYKTMSRSPKLENYIKYFSTFGYNICNNDSFENEFDKIAIYIDSDGNVTHASKQFQNMWRSKLGESNIIEHKLEWLSGYDFDNYGDIGAIMKRKK